MRVPLTRYEKEATFYRWGEDCFHCGRKTKEMLAKRKRKKLQRTIDHLIPVYIGGTNSLENLVVSCQSCNSARGPMTVDEFKSYLINKNRYFKAI